MTFQCPTCGHEYNTRVDCGLTGRTLHAVVKCRCGELLDIYLEPPYDPYTSRVRRWADNARRSLGFEVSTPQIMVPEPKVSIRCRKPGLTL